MIVWRVILSLLLALTLGLGAVGEAVARAAMIGGSEVVVCGAGPVALDASGKPLPVGRPCTHCLAALALAVGPVAWQGLHPVLMVARLGPMGDYAAPVLALLRREPARGPPLRGI